MIFSGKLFLSSTFQMFDGSNLNSYDVFWCSNDWIFSLHPHSEKKSNIKQINGKHLAWRKTQQACFFYFAILVAFFDSLIIFRTISTTVLILLLVVTAVCICIKPRVANQSAATSIGHCSFKKHSFIHKYLYSYIVSMI